MWTITRRGAEAVGLIPGEIQLLICWLVVGAALAAPAFLPRNRMVQSVFVFLLGWTSLVFCWEPWRAVDVSGVISVGWGAWLSWSLIRRPREGERGGWTALELVSATLAVSALVTLEWFHHGELVFWLSKQNMATFDLAASDEHIRNARHLYHATILSASACVAGTLGLASSSSVWDGVRRVALRHGRHASRT